MRRLLNTMLFAHSVVGQKAPKPHNNHPSPRPFPRRVYLPVVVVVRLTVAIARVPLAELLVLRTVELRHQVARVLGVQVVLAPVVPVVPFTLPYQDRQQVETPWSIE
eukprot:47985-Eustigmatos_ZCMA.PRE.1